MKLTQLKEKIEEALKLHDDYEVAIVTGEDDPKIRPHIEDCSISPDRHSFLINLEDFGCEGYHVEDDEDMEHCGICDVYYPGNIECPRCELDLLKEQSKEKKKVYILYNEFGHEIEKASVNRRKMRALCEEYNEKGDIGPYCVIRIDLEG